MDYPPLSVTLARRAAHHTARGRAAARDVLARLREAGVSAKLFGSAARGDMHADSDIDLLVLDRGGVPALDVVEIAEQAAAGRVAVDVVFAEHTHPEVVASMSSGALDERDLAR